MSLVLMAEIIKQVRKTNRGREDEPSIFEFTSTHPGGETLIPGLCNFRRLLGSTPWDIFITVFPPCERWGRIPFVTTNPHQETFYFTTPTAKNNSSN